MQHDKIPKKKTRGQRKTKQHSLKIVLAEFVPMDTLIKESPQAKHNRKRKGNQDPGMPNKPRRTSIFMLL
jgi:hypothetical protein